MNKSTPNNSEKPHQKFRLNARLKTSVITDVVLIFILAALFFFSTLSDQPLEDVFFSLEAPLEVTVCADTYTFSVEYLNTSGFPLTNQQVTIDLPAGLNYIGGSLNDTSTLDVVEHDITDLSRPVFRLNNLADGASVGFSIDYEVSIPAMEEILNEGVLQNKVILQSNEGTAESLSAPYNALYAALNIIEIDPANQNLVSGDTATRTIKIVNGGYGKLSSFFLTDVHGDGIELIATDLGQINATKDTIFLQGSDFSGIGNGDSFFDNNETLILTESLLAFGCSGSTISSSIDAGWACKGEMLVDATMNANISTSLKLPSLSLSTKNALSSCFGPSTANTQEITVKNNGQGIAIDVELDIWKSTGGNYTENIFTRFDTSSLLISVNGGTPEKISPRLVYTTKNTGDYACLGANPIGRVILDLPDLAPQANAKISWDTYNCCINVCNNETNTGWKTKLSYTDACETAVKTASKVGENDLRGKMTVFVENPYFLRSGQNGTYNFTISSFSNNLPAGPGANYELVFSIPEGLAWSGNASDLNFASGTKSWTPFLLAYDANQRTLTAKYPLPAPFNLPKAEIGLNLSVDCSEIDGESREVDLSMEVNYIADTTCTETCSIPFLCSSIASTQILCPDECDEGLSLISYDAKRTSFGIADNNQDGSPDESGALDMSKIKSNRLMVGDTLRTTFVAKVSELSASIGFPYGYASNAIELGKNLSHVGASLRVYDQSQGTYKTTDSVQVSSTISGNDQTFYYGFGSSGIKDSVSRTKSSKKDLIQTISKLKADQHRGKGYLALKDDLEPYAPNAGIYVLAKEHDFKQKTAIASFEESNILIPEFNDPRSILTDCDDCNVLVCDENGCSDGSNANGVQTDTDCGCGIPTGSNKRACAKIFLDLSNHPNFVAGSTMEIEVVSQSSGNTNFYLSDDNCSVSDCSSPDHVVSSGSTFTFTTDQNYAYLMVCKTGGSGRRDISFTVSSLNEICNNGIDDDGDGLIDCADASCETPSINSIDAAAPTAASCPNLNDGTIAISAQGGSLEYSIDNGLTYQDSPNFSGLTSATYQILVRNKESLCTVSEQITLSQIDCNSDLYGKCFDLVYPVQVEYPGGSSISYASESSLETAIDTWVDANPNAASWPKLQYPLSIQTKNNQTMAISSDRELSSLYLDCKEALLEKNGYLDILVDIPEIGLLYPVSVILPSGDVQSANSDTDLDNINNDWAANNPNSAESPGLIYPVNLDLDEQTYDFDQFLFEDGDSIWLTIDYLQSGNIGGKIEQAKIDTDIYLSDIENPTNSSDKFSCINWGGSFSMIGYFFKNEKGSKTTISSCDKVINQDFKLSIGDCCSNYNGGNLFPYEYRQWAHLKKAQFTIPDHYDVLEIYMKHRATKHTNATITKNINNIKPDSVVGNTYHINLEQFFTGHGGSVLKSDDGFRATMYVKLAPSCDVPKNTYQDVDWKVTFQESDFLSNAETDWYTSNPDQIRFSPPSLQLSSPTPIIDGLGKNISWTLNVKSGGGGSNNSWVHIKVPNNDVSITSVVDQASGDTLEYSGDIYKLGAISGNATRKIAINARYSACQPTYIDVFAGYECSAYPDSFSTFKCSYTQTKLEVEPEPSELQMRLSGDRFSENCEVYTDIEVELASVKQGYVGDIQLKVVLPGNNSMSLVSDSTKLKYPLIGSYNYIPNPSVLNDEFVIDINNEVAEIAYDGLVGITNTEKNRLKVAFRIKNESGYKAGDLITVVANSFEPCGQALPSITVPFDVNMKFTRPVIAGLTDDKGNNWSGAWGDFNNDGYEDLYVAEFNHWEAGKLYINDGSGQFTVSTSAGPPIQDKGASAGASWGDYDNDGDLDLFVSNNVRAVNHLYQNNGDGTFSRQDSIGEISSYEGYCHNAAWIDYDNDGWLDIFVSDYMPTRYNQLYHNNGDGSFSRATDNPIALEAKFSMGATWADYDNDGLLDLFVPNGRDDNNSLYHNEGNGQFTKITEGDIVNDGGNSTGSSWGDFDNDGDMDLFVTNASNQNNFFYVNNGDGTFSKNYTSIITQDGGHSHGSGWADMNKDGFLDLFVGNDAGNKNFFYVNNGDGTFRRSEMFDEDLENTMGVAFADYDLDGDLDIFLANNGNQDNTIYNNEANPCISWKCFELKGVRSNKSAVGAKIRIKSSIYGKSIWQTREISTQTGGGSSSQSSIRAYFGLGDASNIDSVIIDWPSGFEQHLTNVSLNDCQTVIEEDGAEICGVVYYDLNGNCQQDEGEPGVPNILLEVMPGPKYVTTNDSGEYRIYRQYGTYTISSISTDEWSNVTSCDSSHTIVYESANKAASLSFCGKNFAMNPSCPKPDLVTYLSSTALRRGFRNSYAISFLNRGALGASNLELVVEFDNDIIPLNSDVPWNQMTEGLNVTEFVWNLNELKPMQQGTIMITDSVSATATLGKRAEVRAYFRNPPDDCDLSNNMRIDYNEIVGAVDPNDILVFPTGAIEKEDELTYKIRFQNVGSKFAQRVFIQDTISPYLDLASFELQGASHDYKYQISEDRVISFTFDRIFLPDSNSNEAASHGFIEFKIKPGQAIPAGTIIENRAAIQFDYNEFIITNTVQNQVVNSLEWAEQNKLYLSVSPNPLEVEAHAEIRHIEDAGVRIPIDKLEIFTLNGSLISANTKLNSASVSIRKSHLKLGLYLVKAYDKNGFSYTEKLEVK